MKDFSLANNEETHSSTKEENEKRFFFNLSASKERKGKYRQAKNQEKKFWPKSQIKKNQSKKSHNSNCKNNDSHTCLKTVIFFNFSDNVLNEKKQAKGKTNLKLLTAHTEIQTPERNNSYQGKGSMPYPQQQVSCTSTWLSLKQNACEREMNSDRGHVHAG
jgi:hypothetical protein